VLFYSNINGSFWDIFAEADHLGQKWHPFLFLFLWVFRKVLMQGTYLHEYWCQTSIYAAKKQYICEPIQTFCLFSELKSFYTTRTIFISWVLPVCVSKLVSSFAGLHVCLAPCASSWHLLELIDSGVEGFLCIEKQPGGGEPPPGFSCRLLLITIVWPWSSMLLCSDKLQLL